jgi:hypothetical protein
MQRSLVVLVHRVWDLLPAATSDRSSSRGWDLRRLFDGRPRQLLLVMLLLELKPPSLLLLLLLVASSVHIVQRT